MRKKKVALTGLKINDPDPAIELLDKWSEIKKGDRYYQYKRSVFVSLSKHWQKRKAYEKVAKVSQQFLAEDDRDIVMFQVWAQAALNLPQMRKDTEQRIYETWNRFPESLALSKLYMVRVLDWEDSEKVRDALNRSAYTNLKTVKDTGWAIYWSAGSDFSAKRVQPVRLEIANNVGRLTITAPGDTKVIRVDPPGGSWLQLHDFNVSVEDKTKAFKLADLKNLHMVKVSDGVLKTSGGNDPYFSLELSELVKENSRNRPLDIEVTFHARPSQPKLPKELLGKNSRQ